MGRRRGRSRRGAGLDKVGGQAGPASPALLTWLSGQMTEEDLTEIAALDYMTDVPQHLAALRRVVAGDLSVLSPLDWHPQEVLQLARWEEVEDGSAVRHRRRLFATTALLVAAGERVNWDRTLSINESAITAVDSALTAFPERAGELAEVIFALAERWERTDELPHLKLATLLLRESTGAPPEELAALVEDADRLATSARDELYSLAKAPKGRYGWVLDLTGFDQRARLWRKLLDAALERMMERQETATAAEKLCALRERRQ